VGAGAVMIAPCRCDASRNRLGRPYGRSDTARGLSKSSWRSSVKSGVCTVVDVRRLPGSRHNPQFNQQALAARIAQERIAYRHAVELGGRLSGEPGEDRFGCLRVAAFRSYAARIGTESWQQALAAALAEPGPCFMCSETLWWRCHRRELLHARGRACRAPARPWQAAGAQDDDRSGGAEWASLSLRRARCVALRRPARRGHPARPNATSSGASPLGRRIPAPTSNMSPATAGQAFTPAPIRLCQSMLPSRTANAYTTPP
jgi:hypothetical protein